MVIVEVDLKFGVLAIANPLPIEVHQIRGVHSGTGGSLNVDKQLAITRIMIERNDQMQRMSGKRLAQPFGGSYQLPS